MTSLTGYATGFIEQRQERAQELKDLYSTQAQQYETIDSAISERFPTRTHDLRHKGEGSQGVLDVLVDPRPDVLTATVEELQSLDALRNYDFEFGNVVSRRGGRCIAPFTGETPHKIAYCESQWGESGIGYVTLFNTQNTDLELLLKVGNPTEPLLHKFGEGLKNIYRKVRDEY